MASARTFSQSMAPLVNLIYPPRCPLCGGSIAQQSGLCAGCWGDLQIPTEPACAKCQCPFLSESVEDGAICAPCMAQPPRHGGIAAGTIYNEASRQLVLSFKHGGRIAMAPMLARLIAGKLHYADESWTLVPVPLHRWRLWGRGYNQAALLATELAKVTGARLEVQGLRRDKKTPPLAGLGRNARARALAGAISVSPQMAPRIAGKKIILVDDVLTSGATSDSCVRALQAAGASEVKIACFARVLDDVRVAEELPNWRLENETPET